MNDQKKSSKSVAKTENPKEEPSKQEILQAVRKDPTIIKETFFGMMKGGMSYPPFLDKVDKNHITKALSIMSKEVDNAFKTGKSKRNYTLIYVLIGVALFIFLMIYLVTTNNTEMLTEILKIGGAVVVGGFGGYGISESKHKKS